MKEIRFLPTSVEFYDQTKISRPTYMRGVGFMAEQRGTGGEGVFFRYLLLFEGWNYYIFMRVNIFTQLRGVIFFTYSRGDILPTGGVIC